jgi:hypothetical protein
VNEHGPHRGLAHASHLVFPNVLSFVKDLKSLFFSIPVFGYGSVGLLMACVTEGLTTFVTPFYL